MAVTSLALVFGLLAPSGASARLSGEFTYTYEQLWRASVRLIAVDFRFPITQRDEEIGYLLFDYTERGQTYHGSLELVRTEGPRGAPQVRVTFQVPAMPSYVERMMLDRLRSKLVSDYGQPPPSRPAPSRPAPDRPGRERRDGSSGDADDGETDEASEAGGSDG